MSLNLIMILFHAVNLLYFEKEQDLLIFNFMSYSSKILISSETNFDRKVKIKKGKNIEVIESFLFSDYD